MNNDMWKNFPEIWMIDVTYGVSRVNLPLCQIIGTTGVGHAFPIGFAFIKNEDEETSSWIFSQLQACATEKGIPPPSIIITNFHEKHTNAIRATS